MKLRPVLTGLCLVVLAAFSAVPSIASLGEYDARVAIEPEGVRPTARQEAAIDALRQDEPALVADIDARTGATRRLFVRGGYLTQPSDGAADAVAFGFVSAHLDALGLSSSDWSDFEVTDDASSTNTGARRLYLRQIHEGIPVYNGQMAITVNRDGRIQGVNNLFLPNLAAAAPSRVPGLSAAEAVRRAGADAGFGDIGSPRVVGQEAGPRRTTTLEHEISTEPIVASLVWVPVASGRAELAWNFQIATADSRHWWDYSIDAHSGDVWIRGDWVDESGDSYRVVPTPFESPDHLAVPPPLDGRTVEFDPHDLTASPFNWHDTNGVPGAEFDTMQGNNVDAYEDSDANNVPPATRPSCGIPANCDFDFPIDFGSQAPSTYQDAAVANLFYWNNIIHDIQFHYGFDSPGGNFQVNTYGLGGLGGDDVRAEAQDGGGNCNANFLTLPDGSRPRMQMFTCNIATPARDGDFDNLVIVHEYGHGISNRLVGGPSNTGCLGNSQQPGEGLSDWWGLWHTMEVGDQGADARGVGAYLFGQGPNGPGIRGLPYSTDEGINNWDYESINGASIPHGVGSRWAQAYWEVTWALMDTYGFDPDFYSGTGGNNRALFYLNEGLKNTICSPAFTDVRDGIIQAAEDNNGGADVCILWNAFAGFGLGEDAVSGGPNSTNPTNGFAVPVECQPIFTDGFESGDTSAWSSTVP